MERGAAMDIRYHNYSAILFYNGHHFMAGTYNLKLGVFVDKLEEELWTSDTTITALLYQD